MDTNTGVAGKVFSILELLAQSGQELGPTEIAKALDLNKTTIYRLLKTMVERGYAVKSKGGTYTIGPKLTEIASYNINRLELQTEAKPYLSMLYTELGLSVHLGVLDGTDIVYIEKMDLYPTSPSFAQVGYRSPAYCSSIGKCLLASLSGDALDEALYSYHFVQHTPNTITNLQEFKKVLRKVRTQGWAIDNEEYLLGNRCVGAPVYDYRGDAIACISVSGSKEQLSDERLPVIIDKVRQTAVLVSKRMGYTGYPEC